MANVSTYSKGAFAKQLGISRGELESRARDAGFGATEDYYKSGLWRSAGGQIDPSKIPSTLGFAQEQEKGIAESLKQLVMGYRAQRKPLDVYTELEEAAGLPAQKKVAQTLRDQIASLEDTIRRVRPNIAKTTRQSMVTEAQREKMEIAEKRPFLERLGEFSVALGRIDESIAAGMADLSNKVNLFLQGERMALEPLKLQYTSMVDRAARLTSAFGVDAQNQLEVYLANVRRGWELADQAREEAFALIQNENAYTRSLEKIAAQAGVDVSGYGSTEDLLKMIGDAAAEQIAYDRAQKEKESPDPTPIPDDTTGINWDDWEEVDQGTGEADLMNYVYDDTLG